MLRKTILFVVVVSAGLGLLALSGCNDDLITSTSSSPATDTDVRAWVPLDAGYTTIYQVDYSNGASETITFEVGDEVPFGYETAHEWTIESSTGEVSTAYLVVSGSDLLYYDNFRSSPEKILSLPLNPGATWQRFSSVSEEGDEEDSTITELWPGWDDKLGDIPDIFDPLKDDVGGIYKSFPSVGGNDMNVDNVGSLSLSTGAAYSGAVRISNAGTVGKTNYYWYAPSIGLVRYVIGATEGNINSGEVVGELVSYHHQQ